MLQKNTRKQLQLGKLFVEKKNAYDTRTGLKTRAKAAITDLTLMLKYLKKNKPFGESLEEEIFTEKNLEPLFRELLEPSSKRTVLITEIMANLIFQKLSRELPIDMVNSLSGDIGKTWTYARLLAKYHDKPLARKN